MKLGTKYLHSAQIISQVGIHLVDIPITWSRSGWHNLACLCNACPWLNNHPDWYQLEQRLPWWYQVGNHNERIWHSLLQDSALENLRASSVLWSIVSRTNLDLSILPFTSNKSIIQKHYFFAYWLSCSNRNQSISYYIFFISGLLLSFEMHVGGFGFIWLMSHESLIPCLSKRF